MTESFGPYPEYREVSTSHGVFGVPEGQVLSFDEHGAAVFSEPAVETVITGDGDAEFDVFVAGTTDDEDSVPAPDADDASDEES